MSAPPDRRVQYAGHIVNLGLETATLPNGRTVELEIIRHPGASAIVPVHADGTVTLVHQHRHAAGGMIYEIPAGVLDPGELPMACAARELAEEVQLQGRLTPIGCIHTTPGFTDERIWLFLAQDLGPADAAPEDDEYIEVVRIPMRRALAMTADGRITDAKTICALHLAAAALAGPRG
jgi:ADP-ribose pyrophosphatase